jgi:hypothetical protein
MKLNRERICLAKKVGGRVKWQRGLCLIYRYAEFSLCGAHDLAESLDDARDDHGFVDFNLNFYYARTSFALQ